LSEAIELLGERESYGFKEPVYLARRADGQFLRLSRLLHLVAAEADGRKDYGQIALRVSREFGRTISADNVRFLVEERLRPLGVLAATEGTRSHRLAELPRAKPVLALTWRAPILPAGVARFVAAVFSPLFFAPVVIAVLGGFAVLGFWLFFVHGLSQSARQVLYQPEHFLMIFGLSFLSGLFHEFGHATACYHSGAKPGRIGVGLYLVWPVFYSDVTDAYRLDRAGRLRTDLGGVYFNVIFSLATADAYFLTGFEPLLLVIFLQQVQMLYQFMPFLRLDGYYLVSDITGVPDLFARIKPILGSMVPGRRTDKQVEELKPWARAVVTAWVLAVIPVLLYLLAVLIVSTPQVYATAWDSFFVHYDKVRDAFGGGKVVHAVAGMLRIVLLVIPVVGATLTLALVGKGLCVAAWKWSEGKPALRVGLTSIALGTLGVALFAWLPNSYNQEPLQRIEHGTVREGIATPEVPAYRPGLTSGRNEGHSRDPGSAEPASGAQVPGHSVAPATASATSSATPTATSSATPATHPLSAPAVSAPDAPPPRLLRRGLD
jgi:putative peptide zinc metalloprotease protein